MMVSLANFFVYFKFSRFSFVTPNARKSNDLNQCENTIFEKDFYRFTSGKEFFSKPDQN